MILRRVARRRDNTAPPRRGLDERTDAFRPGGDRRQLRRDMRSCSRRRIGAAHGSARSEHRRGISVQLALGRRDFSRLLPRCEAEPGRPPCRNQPPDRRGDGSGIGVGDCRRCGAHGRLAREPGRSIHPGQPDQLAPLHAGAAAPAGGRAGLAGGVAQTGCWANYAGGFRSDRAGSCLAPERHRCAWSAAGSSASRHTGMALCWILVPMRS
jgi:hypothetical protein